MEWLISKAKALAEISMPILSDWMSGVTAIVEKKISSLSPGDMQLIVFSICFGVLLSAVMIFLMRFGYRIPQSYTVKPRKITRAQQKQLSVARVISEKSGLILAVDSYLADLVDVRSALKGDRRWISKKKLKDIKVPVAFLHPKTFRIVGAVTNPISVLTTRELKARDKFINRVFASIGVPVLDQTVIQTGAGHEIVQEAKKIHAYARLQSIVPDSRRKAPRSIKKPAVADPVKPGISENGSPSQQTLKKKSSTAKAARLIGKIKEKSESGAQASMTSVAVKTEKLRSELSNRGPLWISKIPRSLYAQVNSLKDGFKKKASRSAESLSRAQQSNDTVARTSVDSDPHEVVDDFLLEVARLQSESEAPPMPKLDIASAGGGRPVNRFR